MQQHAWLRDPKASHWGKVKGAVHCQERNIPLKHALIVWMKLLELMLEIKDYQRRLRPRITVIEDRPQTRLRRISMLGWRFAFT